MKCGNGEAHEKHTVHEMWNGDPSTVITNTCEGVPWELVGEYLGVPLRILAGDQHTIMAFNQADYRNAQFVHSLATSLLTLRETLDNVNIPLGRITIDLRR